MSSRGWCRPVDDWLSTIHDTLVWWTGGAGGHDFSASANGMLEQFLHPAFLCSISVGPCVRAVCPRLCMEYKQHVTQQEKVPTIMHSADACRSIQSAGETATSGQQTSFFTAGCPAAHVLALLTAMEGQKWSDVLRPPRSCCSKPATSCCRTPLLRQLIFVFALFC